MTSRTLTFIACAAAASLQPAALRALDAAPPQAGSAAPLALVSARVTVEGTSNLHPYTASTTAVQIAELRLSAASTDDPLHQALQPGGLAAFDVIVASATLKSPKDGIDKNMHKALKVAEHPQIRFRLRGVEAGANEALRALGTVTIAGVERAIALDVTAVRDGARLAVKGSAPLLMTDFGITPPKAMLGMLKTDPRVTVGFEIVLTESPS